MRALYALIVMPLDVAVSAAARALSFCYDSPTEATFRKSEARCREGQNGHKLRCGIRPQRDSLQFTKGVVQARK